MCTRAEKTQILLLMHNDANALSVQRRLDQVCLTHNDFKQSTVLLGMHKEVLTHTHVLRVNVGMAAIRESVCAVSPTT